MKEFKTFDEFYKKSNEEDMVDYVNYLSDSMNKIIDSQDDRSFNRAVCSARAVNDVCSPRVVSDTRGAKGTSGNMGTGGVAYYDVDAFQPNPKQTWKVNEEELRPLTKEEYELLDVSLDMGYETYLRLWEDKSTTKKNLNKDRVKSKSSLPIVDDPVDHNYLAKSLLNTQNTLQKLSRTSEQIYKKVQPPKISNPNGTTWKSISIEAKVMIIIMAIGIFLSFLTVIILMMK